MSIKPQEKDAIKAIVMDAIKDGQADTLTKKMVVMALLTRLKLPGDHFNKEQRNTVAATAKQVLDEYDAAEAKKASASSPRSSPSKPSPSKATPVPSSPPVAPQKKAKASKPAKPVVSDSEEDDVPSSPPKSKASHGKTSKPAPSKKAASPPPPAAAKGKKRKSQDAFRTSEFINSEGDPITASQAGIVREVSSEPEEQPQKKAKSTKKKDTAEKAPKEKKAPARKRATSVDPDQSELKKLKEFMKACEAQQVWGKVFPKLGLNDTRSQIRYLRQQLKEIGMPNRMSMEAAKKIGSKRALEKEARELGIDFSGDEGGNNKDGNDDDEDENEEGNKTATSTASRPKRAAALKKPPPRQKLKIDSEDDSDEQEQEEDDEEEEETESESASGQSEGGDQGDDGSEESGSSPSEDDSDDADQPKASEKPNAKARKVPPKAGSVKKSKQAVESSDESRSSEVDDDD